MPKPGHRPRRRRAAKTPARNTSDQRGLLERILDTPDIARVVPRLSSDVLHRVIQHSGLEECAELVALATSGQLAAIFDLDLWRASRAGLDEQFDPQRFALWLEV